MKVLFFSHSSGLGGAERSLLMLLDELISLQVECFVVIPHEGPFKQELEQRHLPYQVIDYAWWCDQETLPPQEMTQRNWNSLKSLAAARRELDNWQADIVMTNSLTIPWGTIYSAFSFKPHILFIREFGDKDFSLQFFSGYEPSIKFLAENSEFVLTNSQATLKHFKKIIGGKRLDYVYPTVKIDLETLSLQPAFTHADALKLVVSGAVTESKGQFDAVQAVSILKQKGIEVELILIGSLADTEYVETLRSYLKTNNLVSNVRLLGFTSQPLSYVSQADIVLMCSKNEAFGRVTMEAMALQKPLIGSNSGGTKELITDGETGLLYEAGNAEQLAEKIEYLAGHTAERKRMIKNALARYEAIQKESQFGKKTYNVLVKTKLNALTSLHRSSENTFSFLGLFGTLTGDGWAGLERSLAWSKIQLALNPSALSQRFTRSLSEIT